MTREAAISAEHLATGATIIGKSNYAYHAHFGQAFFSLSTGIERGAKLALAIYHALKNDGDFPEPRVLRSYGHNLSDLLTELDLKAEEAGLPPSERLPRSQIHSGIIRVLTEFASNVTRYYNLDFVMDNVHRDASGDPVKSWYEQVTVPILEKHLKPAKKTKIQEGARMASALMESFSIVSHTSESGEHLSSVYEASLKTGMTEFVNPYVRMYVLHFARFYSHIMSDLTFAAYKKGMSSIPHLSEFFAIFHNEGSYLRNRKVWSIYKP